MTIYICTEFRRQLETSAAVLELVPRVTFDVVKEEQLKIFNEARKARNTSHNSIMKDLASTKVSKHVFMCCTVVTVQETSDNRPPEKLITTLLSIQVSSGIVYASKQNSVVKF